MDNAVKNQLLESTVEAMMNSDDSFCTNCGGVMDLIEHALKSNSTSKAEGIEASLHKAKLTHQQKISEIEAKTQMSNIEIKDKEDKRDELIKGGNSLDEELKNVQQKLQQERINADLVFNEILKVVPKDQYICRLLKNITNIEWDSSCSMDNSVAKGVYATKNEIKSFQFDSKTDDAKAILEKLWSMMKEGEVFASSIDMSA